MATKKQNPMRATQADVKASIEADHPGFFEGAEKTNRKVKPAPEPTPVKKEPPKFLKTKGKPLPEVKASKNHSYDGLLRIVDDNGHLLMKYNVATNCIEIKVPVGRSADKGMFSISLNGIARMAEGNFLRQVPGELVAIRLEGDGAEPPATDEA